MTKVLICYTFEKIDSVRKKQFDRAMFGTEEKTHGGRYTAKIYGLLTEKNYRRPVKSTILVNKKEVKEILKLLKDFSAKYEVFEITSK